MRCNDLDRESREDAMTNMRYEMRILAGLLDMFEIVAENPDYVIDDSMSYAIHGARLILERQKYRMEKYFA